MAMTNVNACGVNGREDGGAAVRGIPRTAERDCMPRARSFSNLDEADVAFERDETISAKILELSSTDDHVLSAAAEFLFEKAHSSNTKSEQNKVQMGRDGAIQELARLLDSADEAVRYQACSALSEIAFRDSWNCFAIASTDGILERILALLRPDAGETQEDAALIINNCAAFCEEAAPLIVQCPEMVDALVALITSDSNPGAKNISVGAINSLSRSEAAKRDLHRPDVLAALAGVLTEAGEGDRHDAKLARAAMAIANLTGEVEPIDGHRSCGGGYAAAIRRAVEVLDLSLAQRSWAGVFFAPYSVLHPLHKLALNPANRARLVEFGLPARLAAFLRRWAEGPRPERALALAMGAIESLAAAGEPARAALRDAGVVGALLDLAAAGGRAAHCPDHEAANTAAAAAAAAGVAPLKYRMRASAAAESLLEAYRAVWMANVDRLGAGSGLGGLDGDVLALIVDMAFGRPSLPSAQPAAAAAEEAR